MALLKSKAKELTKLAVKAGAKPEVHDLKDAYIITKENGDRMIQALGELPGKYWNELIGPMVDMLQKTFRGSVMVTVDPTKAAPPLPGTETPTRKLPPQPKLEPVLKQTPKQDPDA